MSSCGASSVDGCVHSLTAASRCAYKLVRKGRATRLCNFPVRQGVIGAKYCGAHSDLFSACCAYCRTVLHTESVVRAHVKKCPVRKRLVELETQIWYKRDVNTAGYWNERLRFEEEEEKQHSEQQGNEYHRRAQSAVCSALEALRESLATATAATPVDADVAPFLDGWACTEAQSGSSADADGTAVTASPVLAECEGHVKPPGNSKFVDGRSAIRRIRSSRENGLQCAALTGLLLEDMSDLDVSSNCNISSIELCGGRGLLSLKVSDKLHVGWAMDVHIFDIASSRHKADGILRVRHGTNFYRHRADLRDVNLSSLGGIHNSEVILIFGKHLCGNALDYGLRAATGLIRRLGKEVRVQLTLAGCCRAKCEMEEVCGARDFFGQWGIAKDREHVDVLRRISAWGLNDVSDEDKVQYGVLARRVVDKARVEWMGVHGWSHVRLVQYTTESPEDLCIVASWTGEGQEFL